jgi:hypothetical protein
MLHVVCRFHFGQDDTCEVLTHNRLKIGGTNRLRKAGGSNQGINTHIDRTRGNGVYGGPHRWPGSLLLGNRDGVFEVENHRISATLTHLLQHTRTIPRRK